MSVIAYIGLGSNLRNPVAQVTAAIDELAQLPQCALRSKSSLYKSAPVLDDASDDQRDYINAVVSLKTGLAAEDLLKSLFDIEKRHGRVRIKRWGARTLDLDLLLYGNAKIVTPELLVPHPRLHERAFVLYPLSEIAPDLEISGKGTIKELLTCLDRQEVNRLSSEL